jgi:multisubunit Na+/H+ antiporter MnhB subunit
LVSRLRTDIYFFSTVLVTLWLATFSLGVAWAIFRDPPLAIATLIAVGLAFALFFARRTPAAQGRRR